MSLVVRSARENDADAMMRLLNPIIESGKYSIMHESLTIEDQIEYLRDFPSRGVFCVAMDDATDGLLGLQDLIPVSEQPVFAHVAEISTFVALGSRRTGIGRQLCSWTLAAARRKGFRKVIAAVRADNHNALAFYEAMGFRVAGMLRRQAYLNGIFIDQVIAERWLNEAD